jgi:hypothetical protein
LALSEKEFADEVADLEPLDITRLQSGVLDCPEDGLG